MKKYSVNLVDCIFLESLKFHFFAKLQNLIVKDQFSKEQKKFLGLCFSGFGVESKKDFSGFLGLFLLFWVLVKR